MSNTISDKKNRSRASRLRRLHHKEPSIWSFCRRSCRLAVLVRTARRNSTSSCACMVLKLPKTSTRTWIINMSNNAALGINMYVRTKMACPSKCRAYPQKINSPLHMFVSHAVSLRQVWYKIGSHVPAMQVCLAMAGTRLSSSPQSPLTFEFGQSNVWMFGNVARFLSHHSPTRFPSDVKAPTVAWSPSSSTQEPPQLRVAGHSHPRGRSLSSHGVPCVPKAHTCGANIWALHIHDLASLLMAQGREYEEK